MRLTTVGYQRRDLESFVALLTRHDIEAVVDVRGAARSRKAGFSRTRLQQALADAGIAYEHEPDLGVPRADRRAFRAGDPDTVERYRARLDDDARDALDRVAGLAAAKPVALLCFERHEEDCHRRLVADRIETLDPRIERTTLG